MGGCGTWLGGHSLRQTWRVTSLSLTSSNGSDPGREHHDDPSRLPNAPSPGLVALMVTAGFADEVEMRRCRRRDVCRLNVPPKA